MTHADEVITLLLALRRMARTNRAADLGTLAEELHWGVGRVVRVLAAAATKGLADRGRARLTWTGLAVATALDARRASQAA